MEAINDVSKIVAQSIQLLKELNDPQLDNVIKLLEEALEKLVNKM